MDGDKEADLAVRSKNSITLHKERLARKASSERPQEQQQQQQAAATTVQHCPHVDTRLRALSWRRPRPHHNNNNCQRAFVICGSP